MAALVETSGPCLAESRRGRPSVARALGNLDHPDRVVLAVLVALPLVIFALPAVFGHPAVVGDNASQNLPLRELVASQIRQGHLPLFDPYVWSGAPLLAGWNAGAAYPFIVFFVLLPGVAAWTFSLVVTWWVAGIGCFAFLRASRLGPVPSFLGAVSFSFAGAMTAQISHIGLVEGMSWTPVVLLALLRLSQAAGDGELRGQLRPQPNRSALGWAAVLGAAGAMVVLAGEPRAVSDVAVIGGLYATWRAFRLGRNAPRYLILVAGGLGLAVALGAVQLLPGIAAVSTSQRAASNASLFTYGSLPDRWLVLMLVPDVLGGSGSFGAPSFLARYNLLEVTGYIGIMPLVASVALLGRLRRHRPLPEWLVWHVVAIVGVLLALGGNTPLWHILIRLPFFGGQRFQSRNIVIADMGMAFLLAYWADFWLAGARERHRSHLLALATGAWRTRGELVPVGAMFGSRGVFGRRARVLGTLTGLLAAAMAAVGMFWGAGLLLWLGVGARAASLDGRLRVWFLPFGVIGLLAASLLHWGHRLDPIRRKQALVGFVVADVVAFSLMVVVSPFSNLDHSSARTASVSNRTLPTTLRADSTADAFVGAMSAPAAPTSVWATSATSAVSAAAYTGSGRFAVYDPDGIDASQLSVIEAPDLNVLSGLASVQGYGSIVDGAYASATGSHSPTGDRGDILRPSAVGDGTLDQFDTTVLFAPRDYFVVSPTSEPASADPTAGTRKLSAGGRATWYLGEDMGVTAIAVPDATAKADLEKGLRLGVITPAGSTLWAVVRPAPGSTSLRAVFPRPVRAVALVAESPRSSSRLGAPFITSTNGGYTADGQLEAAVVPPRWSFKGRDGSFAVFKNDFAVPPLSLRGSAKASVRAEAGPPFAPTQAAVSSAGGTEVVRSEAAIPGWSATWNPDVGPTVTLPVRRVGLVQGVQVPRGSGVLTWSYDPPGWAAGAATSACGLATLLAICWALANGRRRARSAAMP
jgi:hypothetical protein